MSQVPRKLCIGMSLATTWLSGNSWRNTSSRVDRLYDIEYYIGLAQQAERAKMDFVFRPDSLFIDPSTLAHSIGFSGLDPTLLMTAVAAHTQHIGLLTTASTTFNSPYLLARQMQSLHHISQGRAGWNVVTSLDGHQNFGLADMPDTEFRYARAEEVIEAVKALWHSFPKNSIIEDKAKGQYADTNKICPINFDGQYVATKGPLSLPTHEAGDMPLFQAGASGIGKSFAAQIADGVFAATPDMEAAKTLRQELQQLAEKNGREVDSIKILPGLSLFLAETKVQAEQLLLDARSEDVRERQIQFALNSLGIEVSELSQDTVIDKNMMGVMGRVRSKTHSLLIRRLIERQPMHLEELLLQPEVSGSGHWQIVGTVDDALAEIVKWAKNDAIDGFIALPGGDETSFNLVCEQLMPALTRKGWFRQDYANSTFKSHLQQR
ncbi:MAG: NtaA/DmoA family FMN-dependent monooxygenase [Paraglaciecola sp.]|uniref:NtaA/DmoA family FMN-dependent monooxygenase n=1 Tax=Paraglaciecola sp. TaxID=1920173 RepID=UPI0032992B79